jgi:hypothetical protein
LVLIVALGGLVWVLREQSQRQLTVENRSGQSIAELRVTVAQETVTFRNVPAGKDVSTPLGSSGHVPFTVEGQLADGTVIKSSGHLEEDLHCIVLPGGGIQFRKAQRGDLVNR